MADGEPDASGEGLAEWLRVGEPVHESVGESVRLVDAVDDGDLLPVVETQIV